MFSGWIVLTKFPDFPDCAGVPGQRRTKNPRWKLIKGPLAGKTQEGSSRPVLEKICAHHPPAHADAAAGADSKDSAGPQRHKNEQLFQK